MQAHDIVVLESAQGGRTALHTFLDLHPAVHMVPKSVSRRFINEDCEAGEPFGRHAADHLAPQVNPLTTPPWDYDRLTGILISGWEIDSSTPPGTAHGHVANGLSGLGAPNSTLLQLTRNPDDAVLVTERRLMVENAWKIAAGQPPEFPHTPLDRVFADIQHLISYDEHRRSWLQPDQRWRPVDFTDFAVDRVHESMADIYRFLHIDDTITSDLFTVPLVDMLGHWLTTQNFLFRWHDMQLQVGLDRTALVGLERIDARQPVASTRAELPRMRGGTRHDDLTMLAYAQQWFALHRSVRAELSRTEGPLETFLNEQLIPHVRTTLQTIVDYVAEHCPRALPEDLAAHVRTTLEPRVTETLEARPKLAERWGWTAA